MLVVKTAHNGPTELPAGQVGVPPDIGASGTAWMGSAKCFVTTVRFVQIALPEVLTAMTEHQGRLRAVLKRHEPAMLAKRPARGEWSAIENVRHLILTTQHHLGPFVPGGLGMSTMGLPQGQHPDTNSTTDVAAVLDVWVRVHAKMCEVLDTSNPNVAVSVPQRGVRVLSESFPVASGTSRPTVDSHFAR